MQRLLEGVERGRNVGSRQGIERAEEKAVGSSCKGLEEKIMRSGGTAWRQRNGQEGQPVCVC